MLLLFPCRNNGRMFHIIGQGSSVLSRTNGQGSLGECRRILVAWQTTASNAHPAPVILLAQCDRRVWRNPYGRLLVRSRWALLVLMLLLLIPKAKGICPRTRGGRRPIAAHLWRAPLSPRLTSPNHAFCSYFGKALGILPLVDCSAIDCRVCDEKKLALRSQEYGKREPNKGVLDLGRRRGCR